MNKHNKRNTKHACTPDVCMHIHAYKHVARGRHRIPRFKVFVDIKEAEDNVKWMYTWLRLAARWLAKVVLSER